MHLELTGKYKHQKVCFVKTKKIMHKTAFTARILITTHFIKHVKVVVRRASIFKRQPFTLKKDQFNEVQETLFKERTELSEEEWQKARKLLINDNKYITSHNIDTVILSACKGFDQLPLAKNYVQFLRKNGLEPNDAALGRLLRVYNAAYHGRGGECDSLTPAEQEEILNISDNLRKKYDVLDATTCENIIHGLVATPDWKLGKELLDMIKITSSPTIATYTELIMKSFKVGDMKFGWELLEDQIKLRKQPKCEVFEAYLRAILKEPNDFINNLEILLNFMQKYELIITDTVYNTFKEMEQQLPTAITVSQVTVNRLGQCSACKNFMEKISLQNHEYNELCESFLKKVLIKNDVFQKSTPQEVESFKEFIERTVPYDCVIDGLNVAYSQGAKHSPLHMARLLITVVKHFTKRNKNILILGRKHMNGWPTEAMKYIRRNAQIFLTNNLSQDDPFLLYATLKSGQKTDFLSRDLMRSHSFLLGPELKSVFRRWQKQHQYILLTNTVNGTVTIKDPIRYLTCAHKIKEQHWHIPCTEQYMPKYSDTFEPPSSWLCLKILK